MEVATGDIDAAKAMLRSRRYLYAAFQAQQCAEKALKAVIQEAERVPPRVHDLAALADRAALDDEDLSRRLATLTEYYIATRYPQARKALAGRTDRRVALVLVRTAEEGLQWAQRRLTSTPSSPTSPSA